MISWIKWGIVKTIDDSKVFRKGLYTWLNRSKGQTTVSHVPFGTFGTPVSGNPSIILCMGGKESNTVALDSDPNGRVIKNTKEGEYGICNPKTKTYIYLREDGTVEIQGATDVTINGDDKRFVTQAELQTTIDAFMTELNNHIHTTTATVGPTPTPGVISPPTVPMTFDSSPSATTTVKTGG